MKYHVVFPAEEKNVALRLAELAAKSLCELYGGEASTDNDYSYWVHLLAPVACLDTTENFAVLMHSSNYFDAERDIPALRFRIRSRELRVYRERVNRIRNERRNCFPGTDCRPHAGP